MVAYLTSVDETTLLDSEEVANKFSLLHGLYIATVRTVNALICKSVPLEDLKKQIGHQYPYLEGEVEHAYTTNKVMSLFCKEHDTFPRLVELRRLAYSLQLNEAVKQIDKFDDKRKEVYKTVLAMDFPSIKQESYNHSPYVQVGKKECKTNYTQLLLIFYR